MTQIEYRTDHSLIAAVTAALSTTPGNPPDPIEVMARTDGAVTLTGYARSYPLKEAAKRAAKRVRGVTTVADEMAVQSSLGTRAAVVGSRPVDTAAEVARPVLDVGYLDALSAARWETDGGKGEREAMPDDTHELDAFARILQTAYQEVHRSTPRSRPAVEERLRDKLAAHGVTLTTDVLRALAFAIVTGRDL